MKRFILTMVAVLTLGAAANAMSYKSARDEAFFLTDKMAYELNLTDDQYNAVYEINLDYIMCVDAFEDITGIYWERRNSEMRYVLTPAQYNLFISMEYFYRPISWTNKKFVFTIYTRYPKGRYYHAAPPGYQVYKGSNRYFDHSPYNGRNFSQPAQKSQPKPGQGGYKPGGAMSNHSGTTGHYSKKQAVKAGKQRMEDHNRRR